MILAKTSGVFSPVSVLIYFLDHDPSAIPDLDGLHCTDTVFWNETKHLPKHVAQVLGGHVRNLAPSLPRFSQFVLRLQAQACSSYGWWMWLLPDKRHFLLVELPTTILLSLPRFLIFRTSTTRWAIFTKVSIISCQRPIDRIPGPELHNHPFGSMMIGVVHHLASRARAQSAPNKAEASSVGICTSCLSAGGGREKINLPNSAFVHAVALCRVQHDGSHNISPDRLVCPIEQRGFRSRGRR